MTLRARIDADASGRIEVLGVLQRGSAGLFTTGDADGNAFIESFNASVRKELLNASWFASLADARVRMDAWRKEYNEDGPHTSPQHRTPKE